MSTFIGKSENTQRTIALLDAGRLSAKPTVLWGEPGVGKTALIHALAERHDLTVRVVIGSTLDPSDIQGLPVLSTNEDGQPITDNTLPEWADTLIRLGRGILFLDELSTSTPAVQAAMLTVLQSRMVGRHRIPDDVWIIAAANPAESAADGWVLAAPMANRLLHINYVADPEDWFAGMRVAWGKDDVSETEREARAHIVAFVRAHTKKYLSAMPDNPDEAGRAWPSPRSWDNCATLWGRTTDPIVRNIAMEGFVGEAAASAFNVWFKNLKLPAYELVIANPEKFNWKEFKTDEVYMILHSVLDRVTGDNLKESAKVFEVANTVGQRTDVCAALAMPLIERANDIMAETGKDSRKELFALFKTYGAVLAKAGIN